MRSTNLYPHATISKWLVHPCPKIVIVVVTLILDVLTTYSHLSIQSSIIPILIRVYPRKQGWPDLPHSNRNLSNSRSPSRLIQGILLLQTNTLALLLHLHLPRLLWLSLLPFTSYSNAFLKTCPSSLNTCLYHLTPFTFAI